MKPKMWIPAISCCVIVAASQVHAQDKDVQLNGKNSAQQQFSFTVTTKKSAQGQHFVVKVDPKSQPVKFLGARLSVNDASMVESPQVKGVYSQRTIAVCTVEKVEPEGQKGTAAYGFFVSSQNLEHSTFSIAIASLEPKRSVTHYWFFLKDFVSVEQAAANKTNKKQPKKAG